MSKSASKSRSRRLIFAVCAVVLFASIVAVAAYAAQTSVVNLGSSTLNNNFVMAKGSYSRGVHGTLSVFATGTPAAQAWQESLKTYVGSAQTTTTLGGPGVNSLGVVDNTLYVAVWSPLYGDDPYLPPGSQVSTDLPITGITAATTVEQLRAKIDAALSFAGSTDPNAYLLAGTAGFTSTGKLRVIKNYSEALAEIWVHTYADPNDIHADPIGTSVADGVFGDGIILWGRGAPGIAGYKIGTDNVGYVGSIQATWTPQIPNGLAIGNLGAGFRIGSFVGGVPSEDLAKFRPSLPDTSTGLFTAIRSVSWPSGDVVLWTGSRATPVGNGESLVVFDGGARDPAGPPCTLDQRPGAQVYVSSPSDVATAGVVTTWTVTVMAPQNTTGTWDHRENAYNGISILFPKDKFTLVNDPLNAAFLTALMAAPNSFSTTPSVSTSHTPEGELVTLSGFWTGGSITFQTSLLATTAAGDYNGAKIWIHNVGTQWTTDPSVTTLIDPTHPEAGTDWFPIFCKCGTIPMRIGPDVLSNLIVKADKNRAQGFTPLTVDATDKWGNPIPSSAFSVNVPVLTGVTDGARTQVDPTDALSWIWQLAKTQGINTATITGTEGAVSVTGHVDIDTTGVGDPTHVVVLPTTATVADGQSPEVQIELRDANNNPTSWLDVHHHSVDLFEVTAHSQMNRIPFGLDTVKRYIWRGWARSSADSWGHSADDVWTVADDENVLHPATNWAAWPGAFDFGMTANGPDTWTIGAKDTNGSVEAAQLVTVDITAEDPGLVGVPDHMAVSAVATAPAAYAVRDRLYNNKHDHFPDDAFGVAAADGTSSVVLTARLVDVYGNVVDPIKYATGNATITFEIPKQDEQTNAFLVDGSVEGAHVLTKKTDANGIATISVKSWEPTLERREMRVGDEGRGREFRTWFTPIEAEMNVTPAAASWANPCTAVTGWEGYGFTYFHGALMSAALQQTPEMTGDKDVALADNTDSVSYTATVLDSAFNTPIPNWDVHFTTSLGSFADSSTVVSATTDANGKASVVLKSDTAGRAYLRVYDRYVGRRSPYRSSFAKTVLFTDYQTKFTVNEPTKRAGDRAVALVTTWAENIKTGQKVQWDWSSPRYSPIQNIGDVFGYDDNNIGGMGVGAPIKTNELDMSSVVSTDTNQDGHYDAMSFYIPALDNVNGMGGYGPRLESAGKRYAIAGGTFRLTTWVGNVFYNRDTITAVAARPEVNFVKESTLKAEGTQLTGNVSLVGANFTPGRYAPDYSDRVDLYLGDITTGDTLKLWGHAWVGKDGSLLPMAAVDEDWSRMSPGFYDITVDGLVFKNGLEIKNLFKDSWITIFNDKVLDNHQAVIYLNHKDTYKVNVNALGGNVLKVWAGSLSLTNVTQSGEWILDAGRIREGLHTMQAQVSWPNSGHPYTVLLSRKFYIQQSLSFSATKLSSSGRTLKLTGKVSGPAEASGSTAFAIKVTIQKFTGGSWKTYKVKTVSASGGHYSLNYKVGSAGKYRAVVSHSDAAHPASSKTSNSRTVN